MTKKLTKELRSNPIQTFVYARHGHELMGFKSPVSEPLYFIFIKVQQLLAKGNCKAARLMWEGSL